MDGTDEFQANLSKKVKENADGNRQNSLNVFKVSRNGEDKIDLAFIVAVQTLPRSATLTNAKQTEY